MQDMLGNEIAVGDMVAYPGRQSSSLWMNYGRVVECVEGELNPNPHTPHPYWKWLTHPCIKIRKRQTNWSGETMGERTVRTMKLDRLIVVPHSQFGEVDREFFELGDS